MISAGTCKVGCTVVPKPKEVAGVAKVEVAVKPAVAVKSEIATKPAVAAKTEVAAKPAVVSKTDAVVKTEIAVKSEPSKADPEQKVELRQALAMKPAKAKQTTVNTDQARVDEARADETSAELEGAIPIKWTEVQ
ncbi:unnamed protein product [Rotaria sordida]|uniref:Uncharacterized protein n=1 Tax=Rotaria sordida TaxID=392033 RepID=A0A813MHY7_9BILA|nr:unnamed protein product [Rotaria sordida]